MLTKVTSLNTECPWSLWRFPWLPSSRFGKFRKGPVWFHPAYVGESKAMLEKLRITILQVSHGLDLWHFWSCNSFHKLLPWHKFWEVSWIRMSSQTDGTIEIVLMFLIFWMFEWSCLLLFLLTGNNYDFVSNFEIWSRVAVYYIIFHTICFLVLTMIVVFLLAR